ncbi:transcription factor 25 isoform X2 [Monodelphis domestica]|uniref:transcription factor 25 isoform X2 n=1 Tax=Monodelphis domestica TaxID=13616 RepID=UPI0024E19B36|nr:transcription factor 25 isoform X2 [Monodelphis domestica]
MSRRALRRLRGEQRGQEPLEPGALRLGLEDRDDGGEEDEEEVGQLSSDSRRRRGRRERSAISNLYELITSEEPEDELLSKAGGEDHRLKVQESTENNEVTKNGELEANQEQDGDGLLHENQTATSSQEDDGLEDIDSILEKIEVTNGLSNQSHSSVIMESRPLLYVEHRHLNPETELKRYFGARAVLGDQRPRQRQRQYHRSTWLTIPKSTWPRYSKTGITMRVLESKRGVQHFTFEHHREYQQVQFQFLNAVESMDPNNIVLLLQGNPYHIDSLLQLSDVCRLQEDQEMARDLIERALYSLECAFHPLFSLTSGTCRLDYRRTENRAFYLVLFKHMMFLERRGCPRTALEFCKLILSLDPDNDPLCLLLIIDLLALRARDYGFLIRMFQEWENHRNLSQLPNFAFSVPLAYFFLSQQDDLPELELSSARANASRLIQQALIMFPGVLMPLLDRCSVRPDSVVLAHPFFGLNTQISQPPALTQLVALYIGRTYSLWKDSTIMAWLETNVREVLQRVDAGEPTVEESERRRKVRYQSAPRNIYRHVILSEMKEATAALPLEVTSQPVMGFDPLPPLDSITSYTRPRRAARYSNESTLSLFFRSLLPNFTFQGEDTPDEIDPVGAEEDLDQGLNRLMAAMRDLLANIQFQDPPTENNPDGNGDEDEDEDEDWD